MRELVRAGLRRAGFDVVRLKAPRADMYPPDFSENDRAICATVRPYTMTTPERIFALVRSVQYLIAADVPGAIVECGVYRGGSAMAAALALLHRGARRDLVLCDTFDGMPRPVTADGAWALAEWEKHQALGGWARAGIEDVQRNLGSTGYPAERVRYVRGLVEDTLPAQAPAQIALLRLDTDLYASTKHELEQLYPRLAPGGVLIIDDYGSFEGCRRAVDDYFRDAPLLLNRIDADARIAVKPLYDQRADSQASARAGAPDGAPC